MAKLGVVVKKLSDLLDSVEILHHLFESTYYILDGRGATTIWQHGSAKKQTVEWQAGSLFSPPLNCYYQHFNLDGQKPARLFTATTAPLQINISRDLDFVFNNDYLFKDRYNAEDDYFTNPGKKLATLSLRDRFPYFGRFPRAVKHPDAPLRAAAVAALAGAHGPLGWQWLVTALNDPAEEEKREKLSRGYSHWLELLMIYRAW